VSAPAPEPWSCGDLLSYQGKDYNTLEIGSQCWMAKNLDYDNGCSSNGWVNESDTGWCGYYDGAGSDDTYGLLYQWSAAMNGATTEGAQGICPDGWHIPKENEWNYLENNVCGDTGDEGSALAGDANLWSTSSLEEDNDFNCSGFRWLPAGYRYMTDGTYNDRSDFTGIWTSTETETEAWDRWLDYGTTPLYRSGGNKAGTNSVRCLRD